MALISGGILVLMWILRHDFCGHYNRLALISVDIISGVYCTTYFVQTCIIILPPSKSFMVRKMSSLEPGPSTKQSSFTVTPSFRPWKSAMALRSDAKPNYRIIVYNKAEIGLKMDVRRDIVYDFGIIHRKPHSAEEKEPRVMVN